MEARQREQHRRKFDRLRKHIANPWKNESELGNITKDQESNSASLTGNTVHNPKAHKSFKENQSEHKSDIKVEKVSTHDCCVTDMAGHLEKYGAKHIWYPPIRSTLNRTGALTSCLKLFSYIDQQREEGTASVIGIEPNMPTGITRRLPHWLCDVVVLCKRGSPKLICCFSDGDVSSEDRIQYALKCGRVLKEQFLSSTGNVTLLPLHFHFDIQVLILSESGAVSTQWNSLIEQYVPYPDNSDPSQSQYKVACIGLAERFLDTDYSLTNCRGKMLMEHLTAEQARLIFEREEKVLLVNGRSGTWKTAVALVLIKEAKEMRKYKQQDILYICASDGVKAYVESQQLCKVWEIGNTSLSYDRKAALKDFRLVVVDDAHAITLGKCWTKYPDSQWEKLDDRDLYKLLFTNASRSESTQTVLAIFLDLHQDYKYQTVGKFHEEFDEILRRVALHTNLETDQVQIYPLKKRIRNSRGIQSFIQANLNQALIWDDVPCLNENDGDDVTYSYIGSNVKEIASAIDVILNRLTRQYEKESIVILCDDDDQLETLRQQLTILNRQIQNATTFPIKEIVMCQMEDFAGLEADVVLFLLPQNWGSEYMGNWKYVYSVSSRAIMRLEFLLPWDPVE